MSVIAIVSQKGGSGKTTLALHLAASATQAKRPACIVDTDPQATAAAWGDWRGDFLPIVVTSPPARLAKTIERAREAAEALLSEDPELAGSPDLAAAVAVVERSAASEFMEKG